MPPPMQPKPIRVGAWELQHHVLKPTRCLLQTHAVRLHRALQQPHDFVTFVCSSHPPTPHPPPEHDDAASGRVTIHRLLLEAAGTPLRALVSGPFKEAAENSITVHERFDSFEVVRKFLHCEPINMDHVPAELPLVADRWGLTTLFSACFRHAEERARSHSHTERIHVAELVSRFLPVMAIVDVPSRFKTYLAMRIAVEMRLLNSYFADHPVQISPLCRDTICSMHHTDGVQCRRHKSTILSADSLPTTQVENPSATCVPHIESASPIETQSQTSSPSASPCPANATQSHHSTQQPQHKSDEKQHPPTELDSEPSVHTNQLQPHHSHPLPSEEHQHSLPNHSPSSESPPLKPSPQNDHNPSTDSVSQNGHLAQGKTLNHNHSQPLAPESSTSSGEPPVDKHSNAEKELPAPVIPETHAHTNDAVGNSLHSDQHVSVPNDVQSQPHAEQKKGQDTSVSVPQQETSEAAAAPDANHHVPPESPQSEQDAGQTTQSKPENTSEETEEKSEEQETTTSTEGTTPVAAQDASEQCEGETHPPSSEQPLEQATADASEESAQPTVPDESAQAAAPDESQQSTEQPEAPADVAEHPAEDGAGDTSEQPTEQPATDEQSALPEASSTEIGADDDANQSESQADAADQTVASSIADGDTNADADSNADAVSDAADSTSPPASIEPDLPVYEVDPEEAKPQDWHKTFDIWNVFHQRSMLHQVIHFMSNYGSDNYIPLLLDVILNQLESTLSDDEILRFLRKCDWVWDAPALPILCDIGKNWGPRAWRLLACAQTGYYGEGKEFQMFWNYTGLAGDIRARSLEVTHKPSDSESESSHTSTHDDAFVARWDRKVMDDEFEFTMELFIGDVGEPWEDLTPLYLKIRLLEKDDHPISSDAGKRKVNVRINDIESGCGCVLGGSHPKLGSTASSSDGVLKRSTIDGFRNSSPNNNGYSYIVMDGRELKDWLETHSRHCGLALQVRLYVAPEDSAWSETGSSSSVETIRCTCGYCECEACDQSSDDEQSEDHSEHDNESGSDNDNDS